MKTSLQAAGRVLLRRPQRIVGAVADVEAPSQDARKRPGAVVMSGLLTAVHRTVFGFLSHWENENGHPSQRGISLDRLTFHLRTLFKQPSLVLPAGLDSMEVVLPPPVKLVPRYCLLGLLLLPIIFVPRFTWWLRLVACVVPLVVTGTYRISSINGDRFRTRLYFAFLRVKEEKCNLPGVVYIETKYNASGLFSALMFFFGFIFDLLIPALGGAYEIWLVTAKGREIVAWQGLDQNQFDENLALLASRTGAEVRGRSR